VAVFFSIYRPKVYHIPLIILAMIGFFAAAPKNYVERIFSLQEFISTPGSLRTEDMALRGRASASLAAFEMIRSHPLFGVGLNNYNNLFPQYSKLSGLAIDTETEAHNLYLEVAAETGLVGFTVFLVIIVSSGNTILRARKRFLAAGQEDMVGLTTGFGVGFLAYMFAATFIHGAYPRYFYLLIGIALALELVSRQAIRIPASAPLPSALSLNNEAKVGPFVHGES
jgi:O-antigen ligase